MALKRRPLDCRCQLAHIYGKFDFTLIKQKQALYHNPAFREVVGDVLRPGGLSLTMDFIEMCQWPTGAKIADIGCGAGATLALLREKGYDAYGFDIDRAMLAEASVKSRAKVFNASAEKLPAADGYFDGLICECVLSLTPDPSLALKEFNRVLKPGAYLILADLSISSNNNASVKEHLPNNIGAVTVAENSKRLTDSGFSILKMLQSHEVVKQLAAQMLWAGVSCNCPNSLGFFNGPKLSYAIWLARKI